MEAKSVILNVLIISLILAQIQVEAYKICCPNKEARSAYIICRFRGDVSIVFCAIKSGCKLFDGTNCPPDFPQDSLKNSGDAVNEYCKLGCASSMCGGTLTTLQNSGASETMSGVVEQCTKACSILCNKGFVKPMLETV